METEVVEFSLSMSIQLIRDKLLGDRQGPVNHEMPQALTLGTRIKSWGNK